MKKTIIIATSIILILFMLMGCKKKDVEKISELKDLPTPFIYAPLPPFKAVFDILDYLKLSDYDQAIDKKLFSTKQETGRMSFALGVLTADGIISVRGHNKTKINGIAEEMIKISNFLGLDESILKLADQLKELIANDKWDEMEQALEFYRKEVEGTLYQSQEFDKFTLMQLGGWTEGLNRIAWFIQKKYQSEKTKVLMQKGTLNSLIKNVGFINTPSIKEEAYYQTIVNKLNEIKKIIDSSQNDTLTKEQVSQLLTLSDEIKRAMLK